LNHSEQLIADRIWDSGSQTIGLYCSYYRDTTPSRPCVKCRSKM